MALWRAAPVFTNVSDCPAPMVIVPGEKLKSAMRTSPVAVTGGGAAAAPAAAAVSPAVPVTAMVPFMSGWMSQM